MRRRPKTRLLAEQNRLLARQQAAPAVSHQPTVPAEPANVGSITEQLKGTVMAESDGLDDVARELRLDGGEMLVVGVMQYAMLGHGVAEERSVKTQQAKMRIREEFASSVVANTSSLPSDAAAWARAFATCLASQSRFQQRKTLQEAPAALGPQATRRSRALLMLIELCAFQPWPKGMRWTAKSRQEALVEMAGHLPALGPDDLDAVTREFTIVLRQLRRKQIRWGRVAAASTVGIGLGVATAGIATPAIGAAIGGTAGLTGAAATSAGLALLGGGSLAAGGFGVAGGTALLTGLGAVTGVGVGAAASRLTGWSARQVVADAVKLGVVTRLVVLREQCDEEKAKRVVEALQARLGEVSAKISQLAEQIRQLSEQNQRLSAENRRLRARLRTEHDEAQLAEAALEVVLDRIPSSV